MKSGYLSQYFTGVAVKDLSAVEVNLSVSNQHEFNGVTRLREIFGETRNSFPAKFMYLTDDDDPVTDDGFLTWYNAREGKPRSAEYRLYFPKTMVSMCADEGDSLIIGVQPDGNVLVIITQKGSTIDRQVKWLFGFSDRIHPGFSVRGELESESDRIAFTSSLILEYLGISIEVSEESFLDVMLAKFGPKFPSTSEFSQYARSTLPYVSAKEDPDVALMTWLEREEILFRTMERYLLAERLAKGFADDVDGFIKYSLSVHNRRKSRVGYALENHLQWIWHEFGITYSRGKVTENRSRPDFVFPSVEKYHDPTFSSGLLTMLGVKSTCKDRWRQVLAEADRIPHKHLLTLEAAISENQTEEMRERNLQLVVPLDLQETFSPQQREWLISLKTFISLVKERQNSYSA